MKKQSFLGLCLVLVLIMSGCDQIKGMIKPNPESGTKPECNKPYILVGWGCCLDQNDNKICDKDETNEEEQTQTASSKPNTKTTGPQITASDCIDLKVAYEEQEPYTTTETYTEIEKVRVMDPTPEYLKQKILPYVEDYSFTEEDLINDVVCCTDQGINEVSCDSCFEEKLVQKTREITASKTVTKYRTEKLCGDKLKDVCTVDSSGKTVCPDYCESGTSLNELTCY